MRLNKVLATFASLRFKLLVCLVCALSACQAAPVTPIPVPTMPRPPQAQTLAPPEPATLVPPPTPSPLPTLAVTPTAIPVALDKWPVFESQGKTFSFRYPPDWVGREYTQAITRTILPLTVDFIWLRGPDKATAPEFVVMYNWPSLDPVQSPSNADAWSSVAGLAKIFLYPNCATTFDSPAPLTLSGQQTMGAKFVVQCDRLYAGYVVGIVRKGVNYGLLVDVPVQDWDAWRPTFETMLASFTFGP